MIIFTQFVPEIEMRYTIGYYFIVMISGIFMVNTVLIFYDMIVSAAFNTKHKKYQK